MADVLVADDSFDRTVFKGASCAFGVFDGVHRGHRFLIDAACKTAYQSGGTSVVITFDRDPDELFRRAFLKKLMTNNQRIDMLASLPIDYVVVLPFTPEFAAESPEAFLRSAFRGTPPAFLHVGCDFRFGAKAAGTVDDLCAWANAGVTHICPHDLKSADGLPISATRIRGLLAEGRVFEANALLGRPYLMSGSVLHGRGEGADMGFATANLFVDPLLQAIGDGVYAAWVTVGGVRYRAAVSVGVAPMFAHSATATCEVHILDFAGNLYGHVIDIEFMEWLRPMMTFPSTDALIACVKGNIDWVRANL
ncbi:riboflavin biosynthesis protein RibF [Adlercreutzia sp. ZJ138]|uniref:riboflavin biosynthesis protein RibF n=1 Tax=Adlercreutzia sp. ZJ138 TaxID=2709405 RepID=UPI0013E9D972|nr:riboflavin biosynthesis protein RibF [Adlercreutzia sp. ZJ138]